jgi:hypothetical protein
MSIWSLPDGALRIAAAGGKDDPEDMFVRRRNLLVSPTVASDNPQVRSGKDCHVDTLSDCCAGVHDDERRRLRHRYRSDPDDPDFRQSRLRGHSRRRTSKLRDQRAVVVVHRSAPAGSVLANPNPKGSSAPLIAGAGSLARGRACRSGRRIML